MSGLEVALLSGANQYMEFNNAQKEAEAQGRKIALKRKNEKQAQENLLEKQLASHRARVGAMGLNSGSDDSVQKKMAKDSALKNVYSGQLYDEMQDDLDEGYKKKLVGAGMGLATGMIK
jgi:hypothetical protein